MSQDDPILESEMRTNAYIDRQIQNFLNIEMANARYHADARTRDFQLLALVLITLAIALYALFK